MIACSVLQAQREKRPVLPCPSPFIIIPLHHQTPPTHIPYLLADNLIALCLGIRQALTSARLYTTTWLILSFLFFNSSIWFSFSASPLLHFSMFFGLGEKHAVDASWREHPEAPERSAFVSSGPWFPECSGKSALLITKHIILSFFHLYLFLYSVSSFSVSLIHKSNKKAAFPSPLPPLVCVIVSHWTRTQCHFTSYCIDCAWGKLHA